MKWKNKGHEYDAMWERMKNIDQKYFIFGAGTFGIAFWEEFKDIIEIKAFVDNNPVKQGTKLCGLDVISPDELIALRRNEIIIVSTGLTRGVYDQLNSYGLKRHEDYYHIDEFSSVWKLYHDNRVYVSDLTVNITECCSLKCEYCNAFVPKIQNPRSYDLDFIAKELEYYFNWIDEVNVLGLCGGDAMMHPQFDEILEYIGEKYYPSRVKHLEIYTNAVIEPTERILKLFKKYDIFYRFTDYQGNCGRQNIDKIVSILKHNEIRYDHVQFSTWYDSGYPQKSNGICTEEGLIEFFNKCDRKTAHGIYGKNLFYCVMCEHANIIDYCNLEPTDTFDLSHYDKDRRRELLEYYLGYNEKGYFTYCTMCNGGMNVNTHKIEVGKQLGTK